MPTWYPDDWQPHNWRDDPEWLIVAVVLAIIVGLVVVLVIDGRGI